MYGVYMRYFWQGIMLLGIMELFFFPYPLTRSMTLCSIETRAVGGNRHWPLSVFLPAFSLPTHSLNDAVQH